MKTQKERKEEEVEWLYGLVGVYINCRFTWTNKSNPSRPTGTAANRLSA